MFKKLITWSESDYNQLPWRERRSLYHTLVSEIMLQQTTVSTVMNHFDRFLKVYPDIKTLAKATEEEVCIEWKGLGYYRRARNLRAAAIDIQDRFNGEIPLDYNDLISISGIGEYTANAIIAIGADQRALAIDANLERVLSRIFLIEEFKGPKLQKLIKKKFEEGEILKDLSKWGSRSLNEALMDLGRVYCQARKAECLTCPMKNKCLSFKANKQLEIPLIKEEAKKAKFYELDLLRVVVKKRNKILGYKKSDSEWLSGQIEIPTLILKSEDKKLKQYPKLEDKISLKGLKKYKTSITKYKITNYILEMNEKEFKEISPRKLKFDFYSSDHNISNLSTSTIKALSKIN